MMYVKRIGLSSPEFKLVDYPTVDEPNSDVILKSSDRMKQEKMNLVRISIFSIRFRTMSED